MVYIIPFEFSESIEPGDDNDDACEVDFMNADLRFMW